jgi:hypothetical protein
MAGDLPEEIREAFGRKLGANPASADLPLRIAAAVERPATRQGWLPALALTAGLLVVAALSISLLHLRQQASQPAVSPTAVPTVSVSAPPSASPATSGARGYPVGYGWDGPDGRMMITFTIHDNQQDHTTWTFSGNGWTQVASPSIDHNLTVALLAYDTRRKIEVLVAAAYTSAETWEWNGHSWKRRLTNTIPNIHDQMTTAAYSPELGAVVLLEPGTMPPSMTWLYDGIDWRPIATLHQPPLAHIEYDQTRHAIVALSLADYRTWTFDGHDWIALPLSGPTPIVRTGAGRQGPAVALDQARDEWVVFGGSDGMTTFTDTWIGDGTKWSRPSPSTLPPARSSMPGEVNLAWDRINRRLLLFGGQQVSSGLPLGDTWAWNGDNWSKLAD